MSTDDPGPEERILAFRRRRDPIDLPSDPTDEELARDWMLAESDIREVLRCRGNDHRLWFALQLCTFRKHGRFFEDEVTPPVRIINHLLHQMGLAPILFVQAPTRVATELEHAQRIRHYLGYGSFDKIAQERLETWLSGRAADGLLPLELYDQAEDVLRSWTVQLPAASTLERIVAAVHSRERVEAFGRISGRWSSAMRTAIDDLLRVKDGDHQSDLFHLKEYPGDAKSAEILLYMEKYRSLESIGAATVDSCAPREAQYVLDGLLENNTILRPRQHYTDTHGYTEHIFGLCYLLGITFAPRLRDLADQQLYRIDGGATYPALDTLFRSAVEMDLIREQWDELVRVASSLVRRTAPAHVVVQRLAGGSSSNRLAKALTAVGRIIKTAYILRYIHDDELRSRVQLQLNRGESRHELARCLFFANQGEFRTGD